MQAVPGGKPGPEVLARGGNNTWAPDIIRSGDRYFLYYSAPGPQPKSAIGLLVGRDARSGVARLQVGGRRAGRVVGRRRGLQRDRSGRVPRSDERHGCGSPTVRISATSASSSSTPRTGKRLRPERKPFDIAINSEASIMIFRDGWYYLLVTHGIVLCRRRVPPTTSAWGGRGRSRDHSSTTWASTCCGAAASCSSGRAAASSGRGISVCSTSATVSQKFSLHYEADLDRGGVSVLDIRPLLWRDGWPVAGENLTAGTYQIESARTGTVLELAVAGMPVGGPRPRGPGGPGAAAAPPPPPIPSQDAGARGGEVGERCRRRANGAAHAAGPAEVDDHAGAECGRLSGIALLPDHDRRHRSRAGGHLGRGADRAPAFTGGPEQLWRIDQLADGTCRVMPNAVPGRTEPRALALSAVGSSSPTLARFRVDGDRERWIIKTP